MLEANLGAIELILSLNPLGSASLRQTHAPRMGQRQGTVMRFEALVKLQPIQKNGYGAVDQTWELSTPLFETRPERLHAKILGNACSAAQSICKGYI